VHDQDGIQSPGAHDIASPTEADRGSLAEACRASLGRDQAVSDADRPTATADQATADLDQEASDRDDAGAIRDQRSVDLGQEAADAQRADPERGMDDAYATRKAARAAARIDRLATQASRDESPGAWLAESRGRDRNALRRDDTARLRDHLAVIAEQRVAASGEPIREQLQRLRDLAASAALHDARRSRPA
jgi:hypothetical protein